MTNARSIGAISYTATVVQGAWFGAMKLPYSASSISSIYQASVGTLDPYNVVLNGQGSFPYATVGARCWDSSISNPWLQIDFGSQRTVSAMTVYSRERTSQSMHACTFCSCIRSMLPVGMWADGCQPALPIVHLDVQHCPAYHCLPPFILLPVLLTCNAAGLLTNPAAGTYSSLTGVSIAVTTSNYVQGAAFPTPCDSGVTLQPGVPYTSSGCANKAGSYVLLWRPSSTSFPLCRVDIMANQLGGNNGVTNGLCPFSSANPPPGPWLSQCTYPSVSSSCVLSASCPSTSGFVPTSINIQSCGPNPQLTNNNGVLTCAGKPPLLHACTRVLMGACPALACERAAGIGLSF